MALYPVVVHNGDVFEVHVGVVVLVRTPEVIFSRWKAIRGNYFHLQSFGYSLAHWLLEGSLESSFDSK